MYLLSTISDFIQLTMCNKKAPIKKRQVGNEEKTTNLGLLNISTNSMSWISLETILEVITVLILTILVIRWIRKYLAKRKDAKQRKLMDLIRPSAPTRQASFVSEYPRGFISELPAIQSHSINEHSRKTTSFDDSEDPIGLSAMRL